MFKYAQKVNTLSLLLGAFTVMVLTSGRVQKPIGVNTCLSKLEIDPARHWVKANTELDFSAPQALNSIRIALQADMAVTRLVGLQVASFRRIADHAGQNDTLVVQFHRTINIGQRIKLRVEAHGVVPEQHLKLAVNSFSPVWTEWTDQTNIVPMVLLPRNAARFAYQFHITLPPAYGLQASGQITNARRGQWDVVTNASGFFGLYISSSLQNRRTQIQGITLDVVQPQSTDSTWRKAVATTAAAASFYNKIFGNQRKLTHVMIILPPRISRDTLGGWDYAVPGGTIRLKMTGNHVDDFYGVGHELAHQWWYGAPYSNSNYQSFLNEGFAEYSCLLFYRSEFGQSAFLQLIKRYQIIAESLGSIRLMPNGLTQKQRSKYTYIKAAFTLHQLEQKIGEAAMYQLLQKAVLQQPQSYQEWIELVEREQGPGIRSFYESVF